MNQRPYIVDTTCLCFYSLLLGFRVNAQYRTLNSKYILLHFLKQITIFNLHSTELVPLQTGSQCNILNFFGTL